MAVHSLKTVQRIPVSLETAWSFFSDPANLHRITPGKMGFTIISGIQPSPMYAGQLIEYKVRPLLNIPFYWMTEITHVEEQRMFVDEQRFGPYAFWHHQHHFEAIDGGVEMKDIIHYKVPYGFLGDIANRLFVRGKLEEIFLYRFEKIELLFGKWKGRPLETMPG